MKLIIDLAKIDKSKIVERKYKTQDGVEHTAKEYNLDLVPLKAPKFIKEGVANGKGWTMTKTHFLAESQTKEQREKKEKSNIVGDGIQFSEKADFSDIADSIKVGYDGEVIATDQTPF